MSFKIFPAIDLRDGNCVRLLQGNYSKETVYNSTPLSQAASFKDSGASWIHVVDLDAARSGDPINRPVIEEIANALDIPIQVGGGIRTVEDARQLFDIGVERVVIGTAAIENPEIVHESSKFGRVAVGLDVAGNEIAIHGWIKKTGVSLVEGIRSYSEAEVDALIITQIEQDGTMEGPDLRILVEALQESKVNILASGGVGSLADIMNLKSLEHSGKTLSGVIMGKAIYERKIDLLEALKLEKL